MPKLEGSQEQMASPNWLEMKPSINPKLAQASAITKTINNNNNTNATITLKNESNSTATLESGNKSSSVMPGVSSTTLMSAK